MSCLVKWAESPNDTSGTGRCPAKRFDSILSGTPKLMRTSSPSPPRILDSRPADRYESFQRASRNARAAPLSSTMYSEPGYPSLSMYTSQEISTTSSSPRSQRRSPQPTYVVSQPRARDVSPTFQQMSERPSRTIHSSTFTKSPGKEVFSREVKEIYDENSKRRPVTSGGNTTFDVAPITSPKQISFNPPASSTFYEQSVDEMAESSEMFDSSSYGRSRRNPYSTRTGYPPDATYIKPTRLPRSTFIVPRRYNPNVTYSDPFDSSGSPHDSSGSPYDSSSSPYDSSGSPYETQTFSEEITEVFDSSDEINESLLGKILRGEVGRNIQPMTPSDPSVKPDATINAATYSVTPMQSATSVECACTDGDASLSFTPPFSSNKKKQIKSSIEDELTKREHEERMQLEQDLYRWQQARRRLVMDTSLNENSS